MQESFIQEAKVCVTLQFKLNQSNADFICQDEVRGTLAFACWPEGLNGGLGASACLARLDKM